jgi:transcriptional regulator with XRE-family HTH domain
MQMHSVEQPSVTSYAERLLYRLTIFDISVDSLASESGIRSTQVSQWLDERAYPSARSIARLERALESLVGRALIAETESSRPNSNVREIADHSRDANEGQQRAFHYYSKLELCGGAADGETWFMPAMLTDLVQIATKDIDGNPITVLYEKASSDMDKLVAYEETGDTREDRMALERAFNGSTPSRYVYAGPNE